MSHAYIINDCACSQLATTWVLTKNCLKSKFPNERTYGLYSQVKYLVKYSPNFWYYPSKSGATPSATSIMKLLVAKLLVLVPGNQVILFVSFCFFPCSHWHLGATCGRDRPASHPPIPPGDSRVGRDRPRIAQRWAPTTHLLLPGSPGVVTFLEVVSLAPTRGQQMRS